GDFFANWRPAEKSQAFPRVVRWALAGRHRVMPVPPGHWLLVEDRVPFRACLHAGEVCQHVESIRVTDSHIACFAPRQDQVDARLVLERYADKEQQLEAAIRFLGPNAEMNSLFKEALNPTNIVLLTNGRGAMARMCVDVGRVLSKYDCVLGAN